jgi:copper(I)-binding protein
MRLIITLSMLLLGPGLQALAGPQRVGDIVVHQPWARELPPVSHTGAAYLSIHNTGTQADRLLSARSPIAARVEVHSHEHAGGMMRMQQVEAVALPAGQQVDFAPGGLHLMLIDLRQPLAAGQNFTLELHFEHAGSVQVQVEVHKNAPPKRGSKPLNS